MDTQTLVKRTLSEPASIAYIRGLLRSKRSLGRSELAEAVCTGLGLRDGRGRTQRAGCLKALRELEAVGEFVLPAGGRKHGGWSPRRLSAAVPGAREVPAEVGQVRGLELVLVQSPEQMKIWNELMIREHPQGAGPLVGRQLRYLVGSWHGWLGGIGFAAAALQLGDRDRWIGWDAEQRRAHLHRVVGMSRFLIRPCVHCHNLASKTLSMSIDRVADDYRRIYGYRPWLLESFVDTGRHSGASYQASNWIRVGETKGRGRQDRYTRSGLSRKAIYVYPVEKEFRKRIGVRPGAGLGALGAAEGVETGQWAAWEFGGAPLGDARLSKRLVRVAAAKAEVPDGAFSAVAKGQWAAVKGYYRMIEQADGSAVTMENILRPHRERTLRRMQGQRTVLCVQDGSELDYNNLDRCEGLGEIGSNQTGAKSRGLHLHSTLAVAPNGLPLGVVKAQCIARASSGEQGKGRSGERPIEEKKTFVWIEHHRDLVEAAAGMPQTRLVEVCDREADFYEMFDEHRKEPRVELLIRAKHDRKISAGASKLFAAVRQAPLRSVVSVHIPRQSARPKRSKQKARPKRPGRTAELSVRYLRIELGGSKEDAGQEPIGLWVVHGLEEKPPAGGKAVEWFLLTTIDIRSAEDAERCLRWYCLRWRIEDWHRVLKSGCRIEDLGHETAERLRRAIAINLVIAWRIMLMTLLGRESPELAAEVLFSDIEVRTLKAYAKTRGMKPPSQLGPTIRLVAMLGGYLARNNDPPPGHQLLWQGYLQLQFMCLGFALATGE
jgi:hypothetical protein